MVSVHPRWAVLSPARGAWTLCMAIACVGKWLTKCTSTYYVGTTLRSIINQIADIEDYPGNTTSGVGVAFMQPAGDAGDVDPSTLWTLTPLTASIDFESAFAIS